MRNPLTLFSFHSSQESAHSQREPQCSAVNVNVNHTLYEFLISSYTTSGCVCARGERTRVTGDCQPVYSITFQIFGDTKPLESCAIVCFVSTVRPHRTDSFRRISFL